MILCEMGVAVGLSQGDRGEWSTQFVQIPSDTPETEIEKVAIAMFWQEIDKQESPPDIIHVWLYHYNTDTDGTNG